MIVLKGINWPTSAVLAALLLLTAPLACASETMQARQGEILVTVRGGNAWIHRYSLLTRNPPQVALWVEREDGSFAGTFFVTRKVATGEWPFSGGNPRKEALPVWKHRANDRDLDAVTGASPREAFSVALRATQGSAERRFYLYAEINHSTDFNDSYPKTAKPGEPGYSGGTGGSGQPSLVFRTLIDLDSPAANYAFELVGHGSPDGSSGGIDADLSSLTSALEIVESITAEIAK